MTANELALQMHKKWNGKIETTAKSHVRTREDLAIAYTPGVAEPCKVIAKDPTAAYTYTMKANTIAVVSDGSAVLGLGNIGALAGMPVMEGKAVLFKELGGINAVPICLDTQDTEEIIRTVVNIAPAFGGINLEDISAPRCFEIEERLKELLDIPVFHDDQHGTAIIVLAGIINAMKVAGKDKETAQVVVNGAGSAGVAITKLLLRYGFKHVTMCDINGMLNESSPNLNWMQKEMVKVTNLEGRQGTLADALKGADIFVGVSAPNIVTKEMVASMNHDAILFAMANPVPEIMPDLAKEAGAKVVGTGRSDFPNQINNVMAFPGIFRGALEGHATKITEEMKLACAEAIASLVPDDELTETHIVPDALDPIIADVVSKAVKEQRLKELLDIPVFHDDQHGTAIIVLAGIINAMKVAGKDKETAQVVVNGAGSAGVAITKLLLRYGFKHVTMCDINGMLNESSPNLNWMQKEMVKVTNLEGRQGTLADALKGADIFVGVSAPNIVTKEMVASMNHDAILFAMANPVPEIMPDLAKEAGAKVVGTGRSDFPNQINNVMAFPGIFRGALEGHATKITEEMKLACAEAIASLVPDDELTETHIVPDALDPIIADVVSKAVKELI